MSEKKKIDISKDGFEKLINKVLTNVQEERELALDRYRTQDEQIESMDDFIAIGKDTVSYLKLASERTNQEFLIAKEIGSLVYKTGESTEQASGDGVSDAVRQKIEESIASAQKAKEDKELTKGVDTETED